MNSKLGQVVSVILVLGSMGLVLSSPSTTASRTIQHETSGNAARTSSAIQYWAKTYGGSGHEGARALVATNDGGYIVLGSTTSFGAAGEDSWILKLDSAGNVMWQKTYGGSGYYEPGSIVPTSDGGYVVAGSTRSFSSDGYAMWVLKLDEMGNIIWQKSYQGGANDDTASAILPTSDGGYLVVGKTFTRSFGHDGWLLRLDRAGNVLWHRTYGDIPDEGFYSIVPASDGGYLVTASSPSPFTGMRGTWVLKLDEQGNMTWQRTYSSSGYEGASIFASTDDGGYVMLVASIASDVSSWLVKLDRVGSILWQKPYGSGGQHYLTRATPTSDGGYVMVGLLPSSGSYDAWALKLDGEGNVMWQKRYGGNGYEEAVAVVPTSDGGFIMAGRTTSFGVGGNDLWVLKVAPDGTIGNECPVIHSASVPSGTASLSVTNTAVPTRTTTITVKTTSAIVNTTNVVPQTQCTSTGPNQLVLPIFVRLLPKHYYFPMFMR